MKVLELGQEIDFSFSNLTAGLESERHNEKASLSDALHRKYQDMTCHESAAETPRG